MNQPTSKSVAISGETVISRDRTEIGYTTGARRRCTMAGCTGIRIGVRWNDGKITFPCSKGMSHDGKRTYKLL